MTTRYRVEYALKTHRRDQFIEWIKGLLAVPFVLHSQPTAVYNDGGDASGMADTARERYSQIMQDVERLVLDHINHTKNNKTGVSKLKLLVPPLGTFFTPLRLNDAFLHQDEVRRISSRRFVPPSFNDVRAILNTAQIMSLSKDSGIELVTFDGDVTLYDDGKSLTPDNPVIPRLLSLLKRGIRVGIVTAAGYTEASKYYQRLHGLLDAVHQAKDLGDLRNNLIVMGGESNFLFKYDDDVPERLVWVSRKEWVLEEMKSWTEDAITELLNTAQGALEECIQTMKLDAHILRKSRAVGIVHSIDGAKFPREQLEETVLVTQKILEMSEIGSKLPFCAFNGGNDVFVDIGDKSWGVLTVQRYFGDIAGSKTLHVGDQFLSAGANDFKARLACTTAWIASPAETVALLDEIESFTVNTPVTNGTTEDSIQHAFDNTSAPSSQPDPPQTVKQIVEDILKNANAVGGNGGPFDLTTSGLVATEDFTDSIASQSAATSAYEADTDNASVRSDATLTQSRTGTDIPVLHPRANGTTATNANGSRISSGGSGGSLTLSGGAAVKHDVPTTSEEHAHWIAEAKGRLGKFAGRYGTPKVDGGESAGKGGAAEESTDGAGVDDGWGAPANADADAALAAEVKEETKEQAGAAEVLAW